MVNWFVPAPKLDVGVVASSDFCPNEKLVVRAGAGTGAEAGAVRPNGNDGVPTGVVVDFSSGFVAKGFDPVVIPNENEGAPADAPGVPVEKLEPRGTLLKNGLGLFSLGLTLSSIRVGLSSMRSSLSVVLFGGVT